VPSGVGASPSAAAPHEAQAADGEGGMGGSAGLSSGVSRRCHVLKSRGQDSFLSGFEKMLEISGKTHLSEVI